MESIERLAAAPGASAEPAAARATGRDPGQFEVAVRPLYAPLVRRLVLVLRDEQDAEDIAQDAYLRAFRAWDRFDGRDVRAWLYTIALRLAFNELRRRRRWLGLLAGRVERTRSAPWSDQSDPDLWDALADLDDRTRAALLLSVLDGYTHREIATMLGIPEGTVASAISRGRAVLRARLGRPD